MQAGGALDNMYNDSDSSDPSYGSASDAFESDSDDEGSSKTQSEKVPLPPPRPSSEKVNPTREEGSSPDTTTRRSGTKLVGAGASERGVVCVMK